MSNNHILVIFPVNSNSTLGIESMLSIVLYFTKYFKISILTNNKYFINNHIINCNIIEYNMQTKKCWNPLKQIKQWKKISNFVNSIETDIVFMFELTSALQNWINHPAIMYISQYGERTYNNKNLLKRIYIYLFNKFLDYYSIRGIKKSILNFVPSPLLVEYLNKRGIKNVKYIPHSLNLDKYKEPLLNNDHNILMNLKRNNYFIVSHTGSLNEERGFSLILESFFIATQSNDKIILVLAGANEEYTKKINEFSNRHKITNNIINYGEVDSSIIPGILYYSDVCLSFLDDLPAFRISPPQKIIEYFAAGKPVICNKIATHNYLVDDNKTGFIVDYNPEKVAEKILILANNKEILKKMSDAAKEESKKYDININYKKMVDIIKNNLN